MEFIRSTVAMPKARKFGGPQKYPFASMQPGDSLVTNDFVDAKATAGRLTSAAASYRKRTGTNLRYAVRVLSNDNGTQSIGLWCFAPAVESPVAVAPAVEVPATIAE